MKRPTSVPAYIAAFPPAARKMLRQLRGAVRAAAPEATERISYGIPFYEYRSPGYRGRLVYFAAFRKHVSVYAWGREIDRFPELQKYKTARATIQFPIGTKIPLALVRKVVRARKKAIDGALKKRSLPS